MITLLTGDCRDVLKTLPDASVQCCVTSPPYLGLRDYGTGTWEGGDAGCDHLMAPAKRGNATYTNGQGQSYASNLQSWGDRAVLPPYRDICGKCGARRIDAQIGLEPTPEAFIAELVAVFREVRRILRDDGTVWLNMGDSYASGEVGRHDDGRRCSDGEKREEWKSFGGRQQRPRIGLKPKDLLMMPARVALALQADGWWLRSDIIWAKPNPMPESVTDRCVSAHEHVFMLTKKSRYYFDAQAIVEAAESFERQRSTVIQSPKTRAHPGKHNGDLGINYERATRSCRNVWTIATSPYSAAHFATFPPELAERCIRAGTSERGACSECGAPWTRNRGEAVAAEGRGAGNGFKRDARLSYADDKGPRGDDTHWTPKAYPTTGWRASCTCNADTRPCVVLDPFSGAGTACLVADRLGRNSVGIDLNHQYVELARERLHADCPLFAEISDAPPASEDAYDRDMRDLFAEMEAAE